MPMRVLLYFGRDPKKVQVPAIRATVKLTLRRTYPPYGAECSEGKEENESIRCHIQSGDLGTERSGAT